MSDKYFRGKITFINNDKKKATIEYVTNNKIKTIQAVIDDKQQEKYVQLKLIKKPHRFLVGDNVKFIIKKSSANVFFADHIQYEFNNALEVLINKALTSNKFLGYIKNVDEIYFIKEIDSYLFFPLYISKYEMPPEVSEMEKPISFKLKNIEKPDKLEAELYNHNYTKGFLTAIKQSKKAEPIEAVVSKITPFGIFVTLAESNIECKIPYNDHLKAQVEKEVIIIGTKMLVKITHLTPDRIVVVLVEEELGIGG